MKETMKEQVARAAFLLEQGAGLITWKASRTPTGIGVGWVLGGDHGAAFNPEQR